MVVFELVEESLLLLVGDSWRHSGAIVLLGLIQNNDWQNVTCPTKVHTGSIYVNIFKQLAEALNWLYHLRNLPFKLSNLEHLLLKLPIKQEKVASQFCKVFITCFNFFGETLLMVFVELKTSDNNLLADIKQRNNKCTFRPSYYSKTVANVLILLLTLLPKINITQRLLHVLKVESDSIWFVKHLVHQIFPERNDMLVILLLQLIFEIVRRDYVIECINIASIYLVIDLVLLATWMALVVW